MARAIPTDDVSDRSSPETTRSDKENDQALVRNRKRGSMASRSNTNKRQRLADRTSNIQGSTQSQVPSSQADRNKRYYDPDQDETERRWLRKGLRDLTRDLHDSRSEYLQAGNHGIRDTVKKANEYFDHVKQTSDATIDSRLLVSAADLSYKKTTQLSMGDATAGIDVDEFVSKCITFMRRGPEDSHALLASTTQRIRPRAAGRSQADPEGDSADEDEGDALNWDWLGRSACFQHNARPSVSGFLLGPLSVQKRARQQTQRKARERIDPSQAVRPQELQEEDLDRQETSNLTTMCSKINKLLATTQEQRMDTVDSILRQMEDPSDEVIHEVMDKYEIADDGGIPLFLFCINPRSFGQSVENLFYVSFLVRDGTVGISFDSRELPTLHPTKPYAPIEAQKKGIQKHQAVFSLDFETWKAIIDLYDGKDCIIPHRHEEQQTRRGWYG